MKRIKHIILIILLLSVGFADRQPMKAVTASDSVVDTTVDSLSVKMDSAIRQFVSSRAMTGATVGVCVMDLRTGTPVASYNLERQMIPASVMKIVTSSAALKQLTKN
uniref:D-alanyl-D-alanine carboxypeptidase n=1 Tax=Candidatus Limisoma sp. TaxID=3076476 RepID=UPI003FEF72F8